LSAAGGFMKPNCKHGQLMSHARLICGQAAILKEKANFMRKEP